MKSATLSSNRVIALLETYGGNPGTWPKAERLAAEQCIAQSEQLQILQQQAQQFDQAVSGLFLEQQDKVTDSDLVAIKQRIMNQLPEQQVPNSNHKAFSVLDLFWQRIFNTNYLLPVALGCLAVVMLTSLVIENPSLTETSLSLAEYETLILESYLEPEESKQQHNELQILAFLEPELLDD